MRRLTHLDAGVSGITALSPALSAAVDANRVAFTGYEEGRIGIYFIEGREALSGVAVESTIAEDTPAAAMLPPAMRDERAGRTGAGRCDDRPAG